MKFRKKPVVVEAEQFFPTDKPWPEGVEQYDCRITESAGGTRNTWYGWRVMTIHGDYASVEPGDWIIPEPEPGFYYPVKPDIFEATYEPVLREEPDDGRE